MAHRVTVMTRTDCGPCAKVKADVDRICGELGVPWSAEDVDTSPELRAEYGDRVPVILIDGVEHGYWKLDEDRFHRALAA